LPQFSPLDIDPELMSLFAELRRRNVFRVAVAYAVTAWLLAQVADVAFDNFGTPEWVGKTVLFLLALGFPVAVFFAWAFELTPEGIKKEKDVDRSQSITHETGRRMNYLVIGVLAAAVAFLVFDKFLLRDVVSPAANLAETAATGIATRTDPGGTPPTAGANTQKTAPRATSKPILAVLPFESRSADESDLYFVDRMHDDLLTQLARVGSWKVISRTSVERFRDTTESMPAIGEMLGATNIIEGGVQRAGDRVRINVQLIDAATDEHLWAETYDRALTASNIFEIQTEIATAIAQALQATLSPEDVARIGKASTKNLEAYEAYLLGRERWRERTTESLADAVRLFRRAIDLDPEFARAYVGLGDALRFQVPYSGLPADDMFHRAENARNTALELDDQLGEAYAALGALKSQWNDVDGAIPALERALELDPNYAPAYIWYGITLRFMDRFEEATNIFLKGLELDPLSITLRVNAALAEGSLGRFDEMRAQIERAIEIDPQSPLANGQMGRFHSFVSGRLDEALPWFIKAFEADPGNTRYLGLAAIAYIHLGDADMAARWIRRAEKTTPDSSLLDFPRLMLLVYREDGEGSMKMARRMLEDIHPDIVDLPLALLRDQDLAENRPAAAKKRYLARYPVLFGSGAPEVHRFNVSEAIDIAYLTLESGESRQAEMLLEKIYTVTESMPLLGFNGSWVGNAPVYALRGDRRKALAELRRAVDAGWRARWWYYFDQDPVFESLRDEPEFKALRAGVAADMAEQLARVRGMEASGDIPTPESL
jgi:TolB-like protein/Tfp pilus assembly protein PilF